MTPQTKQLLSALGVAILGAIITTLVPYVAHLPVAWQGIVNAALVGVAHYLPTLGTKDVTRAEVTKQVNEIVQAEK
ncbi:MAG TPA: hypothetical protein VI195_06880 [Steroidobacteraceae bacterium]